MSHATEDRKHLSRWGVAVQTTEAGLAMVLGPDLLTYDLAAPGAQSITGVSATRAEAGELVEIAEGQNILPVRRDPAFTDPVSRGDRLGVGVGGAFVHANGSPPVAIVIEDEAGTGPITAEVAPWATSISGVSLLNRVVAAGEAGNGGVIVIPLSFEPLIPMVQKVTAAGDLSVPTVNVVAAPGSITITGQSPNPFDAGDVAVIYIREA
jgi:hypothetical protein